MIADPARMAPIAEKTSSLLKALSHPARFMICCQLRQNELSVSEIEETLGIRQPRLSRELAKLREEGLVETRREAKSIFYRLSTSSKVAALVDALCTVMTDETPAPTASTAHRGPRGANGAGQFARVFRANQE